MWFVITGHLGTFPGDEKANNIHVLLLQVLNPKVRSTNQVRLEMPSSRSDRVSIFALQQCVWTQIQTLLCRHLTNLIICRLHHLCLFISSSCFCWLVLLILGKQLWQTFAYFDDPCSSRKIKYFPSATTQHRQPCWQLASRANAPVGIVQSDWVELS